jgi:hypothetical protein
MAVKIDTLEKVEPHVAIPAGLGGKANPSHKWRVSARDNTMLKMDHLLHNGSVRLDFMTDDVDEPEEMRIPNGLL